MSQRHRSTKGGLEEKLAEASNNRSSLWTPNRDVTSRENGEETVDSLRRKYFLELDVLRKAVESTLMRLQPFLQKDAYETYRKTIQLDIQYVSPPAMSSCDHNNNCCDCVILRANYDNDMAEATAKYEEVVQKNEELETVTRELRAKQENMESDRAQLEILMNLTQELMGKSPALGAEIGERLSAKTESIMQQRRASVAAGEDGQGLEKMQSACVGLLNNVNGSGRGSGNSNGRGFGASTDTSGTSDAAHRTGVSFGSFGSSSENFGALNESDATSRDTDRSTQLKMKIASRLSMGAQKAQINKISGDLEGQNELLRETAEENDRLCRRLMEAEAKVERLERNEKLAVANRKRDELRAAQEAVRQEERLRTLPAIGASGCRNPEPCTQEDKDASRCATKFRRITNPPHKHVRLPLRGTRVENASPRSLVQGGYLYSNGSSWSMPRLQGLPPTAIDAYIARDGGCNEGNDPEGEAFLQMLLGAMTQK